MGIGLSLFEDLVSKGKKHNPVPISDGGHYSTSSRACACSVSGSSLVWIRS